jgi:hypothetical protein
MASIRMYAVVRKSSEESPFPDWVDTSTLGFSIEVATAIAEKLDKSIPDWAELHPILRVPEFRITEITGDEDGS